MFDSVDLLGVARPFTTGSQAYVGRDGSPSAPPRPIGPPSGMKTQASFGGEGM